MSVLNYALNRNPIIASVTADEALQDAINSTCQIIILIQSDICSLREVVNKVRDSNKLVFVHIDLINGLKRDSSGIRFLAEKIGVDGIVTTQANLIRIAKDNDLLAIQRVFILDSASIEQGIRLINTAKPDAVEILPGIAVPHIYKYVKDKIKQTIIAGGLIDTREEIEKILSNGAQGISSSSVELWKSSEFNQS